jgi:hypothetical protein
MVYVTMLKKTHRLGRRKGFVLIPGSLDYDHDVSIKIMYNNITKYKAFVMIHIVHEN